MSDCAQTIERPAVAADDTSLLRPVPAISVAPVLSQDREGGSDRDDDRPAQSTQARSSESSTGRAARPLRVVVVEDEAIIAMEIEFILQDLGAEVVGIASTAAEALSLARLHRPDFATMDISIKGDRDGVSAAMELYESFGIRSIFVSAFGNDETMERAAAARPLGWVKKPFGSEDLEHALGRVRLDD